VDRAGAGRDQEGTALVLADQPAVAESEAVSDRVAHETRRRLHLARAWQDLEQQRVGGIAAAHATGEAQRDPQGKARAGAVVGVNRELIQAQECEKRRSIGEGICQLSLPGRERFPGIAASRYDSRFLTGLLWRGHGYVQHQRVSWWAQDHA
jgi:hypothetical protein